MQLHKNIKLIKEIQQVVWEVQFSQPRKVLKMSLSHAECMFLGLDTALLVNSPS
jgi:hypothetical protein